MQVSVIVPVYNVEKHLPRCLDSLVGQIEVDDYEIICIDDASTDGSLAILEAYAQSRPQMFKLLKNPENKGQGHSRDRGLQIAEGDYIMFVDSDDYVRIDYLKTFLDAMNDNPCDIVIGSYSDVTPTKSIERTLPHSDWTIVGFGSACAKLFDKNFLKANSIGFSDIRYAEDTYMSLCTFYFNARCHFIDYAGYCYFLNHASTTHKKSYDKNLERILGDLYAAFIESHPLDALPEGRRRMIEYFYISDMLNTILVYNRGCGAERMKDKLAFFMNDLVEKFPDYKNNPYTGFFKPKGQRPKTKLGVGGFMLADRLNLLKPLFLLFS